jgi:hypothetical protein
MATYISKQSGLWSSASTWLTAAAGQTTPTANAGAPPQSGGGDKFIIRGNHTVEYDVVGVFGDGAFATAPLAEGATNATILNSSCIVLSAGNLKCSRTQSTSLTSNGSIFVNFGTGIPTLDWGSSTDPISSAGITAEITFGLPSDTTGNRYGLINRSGAVSDGTTASGIQQSSITICGRSKTRNTTLTTNHTAGTNILNVADTTNWEIGDILVVEVPRLVSSTTLLSNTIGTITNINGNAVTINSTLNDNISAGFYVGNMSSNITFKPGYFVPNSTTACNSFGFNFDANGNNSLYEIKNCSFHNFSGNNGGGIGCIGLNNNTYQRRPVTIDNIGIYSTTSGTQYPGGVFQAYGATYTTTIKNIAFYGGNNVTSIAFSCRLNGTSNISDSVLYRCARVSSITNGFLGLTLSRVRAFCTDYVYGAAVNALKIQNYDSLFRVNKPGGGYFYILGAGTVYDTVLFENCIIEMLNQANPLASVAAPSETASGTYTLNNCILSAVKPALIDNLATTKDFASNIYARNKNPLENFRFNSYYSLSGNYSMRNRGIASYEIAALKPTSASLKTVYDYIVTEKIASKTGIPQRYVGYLRYNTIYGGVDLPYITITDEALTTSVTQTFSCSPMSNEWQKFDLTVTPVIDGDLTLTVTAKTSSLAARVYLDGLTFAPICRDARHYGFVFDSFPYRTVNTLTTLMENQVSAISTVNNLDYLYDASNYWSVTNPSLTAYTDLYTQDGNILDFGSKNIVINNSASTGFAYASASSTLTIKTPLLSGGNNFIGLRTTGNIYLSSGSTIGEIDIYGNLFQATPVSLSGIYMEGTLAYNTNSNTTIEYTDCTMDTVQNDGTGIITIKKTNSTITNGSDAEIVDFIPTILNVNLNGGYLAIYDDTGTRQYYQNTDGTIVLPSNATGTWTYKIARYGYQFIQGSFVVDGNTGATIEIAPSYTPDNFVTSNPATVAAYTDLNTSEKIYNYLNYWTTTTSGIDYVPFYGKAFGSITINKNVTLDATAGSILTYNGSTLLTLKCSGLSEDILFVSNGNVVAQNGTTYSDDVKIRATNINSELILGGVTSLTLFPTENDRDNNTNEGDTLTGTIFRFLYGDVVNGVTLSGTIYAKVDVAGTILLYSDAITTGRNELEFGTTGTLQQIINNQKVINQGIQKASILVPHTTNI